MRLSVFIFLLLLSAEFILAVDRSKFKTCDQASFCKRNRALKEGKSKYSIIESSILMGTSKITADISNPYSETSTLQLEITGLQDNTFRFRIKEKSPPVERFEAKDALIIDETYQSLPLGFEKQSDHLGVVFRNKTRLSIYYSPIKIDVYKDNILAVSVNSRGLLNFEHFRNKEDPQYLPFDFTSSDEESQKNELNSYWHDAWEETFSTHKDHKPNGPTAISLDITFPNSQHLYGIPEHATSLSLGLTRGEGINSDPYRLYNLDVFEYELNNPMALYGSVPFLLSHTEGMSTGVLWLNSAETFVDISQTADTYGKSSHWISESGNIDVFVFTGPTPYDLFRQYTGVTGKSPLPPMFAIAYHQCRWNYKDEADVRGVDQGFDENDIPYDVLWLDIEHTDAKKYFTWDPHHFPTPEKMQKEIEEKHRKMVTIVDPHIKRDGNYYVHNEATSQSLYVKNHDNNDYEGWCWPGSSSWLDFSNPSIRDYWASKFSYSNYKGSTPVLYTWNDMNEPSVFNGPEVTMHKDAKHYGNVEHRELHNMYGYYMHQATWQGLLNRNENKNVRPFLLTRAFFSGSQRYGAVWTGDNAGEWSHLEIAQPMLLSLGVTGIVFSGADVGGFFGNPDAELMTRWYQAGAYHPFFRGHAHLDTKRREPWLFGEPYTSHIRSAIRARYVLLPYWYTTFQNSSVTGLPIIRPMWVEFPQDSDTFAMQDQFMAGSHILVKPVTSQGQSSVTVYFPGTNPWYSMDGTKIYTSGQSVTMATPLDYIPVFQRGGSIIPKKERARRNSELMRKDPYTLQIALSNKWEAQGELYSDDENSYNFEKGEYLKNVFVFENKELKNRVTGNFKCDNVVERLVIYGYTDAPKGVTVNGRALAFEYDQKNKILVVRKPELKIGEEWTVKFN